MSMMDSLPPGPQLKSSASEVDGGPIAMCLLVCRFDSVGVDEIGGGVLCGLFFSLWGWVV